MFDSQVLAALFGALVGGTLTLLSGLLAMRQDRRRHSRERLGELSAALQSMLRDLDPTDEFFAQDLSDASRIRLLQALPWTGGRLSQSLFLTCIQSSTLNLHACGEAHRSAMSTQDEGRRVQLFTAIHEYTVVLEQVAQLLVMRRPVAVCMVWANGIEALSEVLPDDFKRSPYPPLWGTTLVAAWWAEKALWRNLGSRLWSATWNSLKSGDKKSSS